MTVTTALRGLAALLLLTGAAQAADAISVSDPYLLTSRPGAPSGAAFMVLTNNADTADRLTGVASDAAARVELHSNSEDANGVMQMLPIEDGIAIPAGGSHALERGGDHVMFMGLTDAVEQGDTITMTLTFEQAGEIIIEVPVDLTR